MTSEKKKVAEIIKLTKERGRSELLELESKQLLAAWGVPVNRTELAKDRGEAIRIARDVHYPLVMKIASPDVPRKGAVNCVKVGIGSEIELRQAFDEIINNALSHKPNANILGVTVQEYLPPAHEVIIGAEQNPSFGAVVRFSLAKLWADVLNDFSFRLAPLNQEDAREMVQEVKGYPVLEGNRGGPPADVDALVDMIQKVGQLVHEYPEIVGLEIDPAFVFEAGKGAVVADARIVVRREE